MNELLKKVNYQLTTYGIPFRCLCKKCRHQVVKNYRKSKNDNGYKYLCPNCHENLFDDEVIIDDKNLPTRAEKEQLFIDMVEQVKLKGTK